MQQLQQQLHSSQAAKNTDVMVNRDIGKSLTTCELYVYYFLYETYFTLDTISSVEQVIIWVLTIFIL